MFSSTGRAICGGIVTGIGVLALVYGILAWFGGGLIAVPLILFCGLPLTFAGYGLLRARRWALIALPIAAVLVLPLALIGTTTAILIIPLVALLLSFVVLPAGRALFDAPKSAQTVTMATTTTGTAVMWLVACTVFIIPGVFGIVGLLLAASALIASKSLSFSVFSGVVILSLTMFSLVVGICLARKERWAFLAARWIALIAIGLGLSGLIVIFTNSLSGSGLARNMISPSIGSLFFGGFLLPFVFSEPMKTLFGDK